MIVLTGGNGFLGRHLIRALLQTDIDFAALVRVQRPESEIPRSRQVLVHFDRTEDIERAMEGADQVLHLIGRVNGSEKALRESNLEVLNRVLEASRQKGVKRVLFVSSVAAVMRRGAYGDIKWEAEQAVKGSGIPYLIFRPTLIYGSGDSKNLALIEGVVRRFPIVPLLGGGRFLIQPVYVDDVVQVIMRALQSTIKNRSYTLAGPSQISLREMMEGIADSLDRRVLFLPVPLKPVQWMVRLWAFLLSNTRLPVKQILELDRHEAFSVEEARRDLGFSPRPFQKGIRDMLVSESVCAG